MPGSIPLAAYRFLLFEYLRCAGSGWTGIERLEPGTILTFDQGRIGIERYWQPPEAARRAVDPEDATERLDELLRRAARSRPRHIDVDDHLCVARMRPKLQIKRVCAVPEPEAGLRDIRLT
jgi:hypothetical protein